MNKNEYKEALNKIVISDELREKIIHNSSEKKTNIYKRNNIYKYFRKAAGIAACFAFCMLSYHAATNYYRFPADVPLNTTPPTVQSSDNTNISDTKDNTTEPVTPDTDNIQNDINISNERHSSNNVSHTETAVKAPVSHTPSDTANNTASANENNTTNADNPTTMSDTNQSTQSNSVQNIEQDDFPPVLSAPPSMNNNTPTNVVGIENAGGVCAGSLGENMSSVAEIEQKLGYEIKVPNYIPNGYKTDSLSAPFGEFAQITYTNETDTLYYRTAKGSEDISGDYNDYTDVEAVNVNDNDVTIKGNDNRYHNASWCSDDETFSIYSDNGIEKNTMIDIVESVD